MAYKLTEKEKQHFIEVCESSSSMKRASVELNMHFNTFKRIALKLGCYKPNQSGKGMKKAMPVVCTTEDILNGKYPEYSTYKLKKRLIKEGIKEDRCELCGWSEKREGEELSPCELHHKDGNAYNHSLDNLIILCPNCHSLTSNYRAKNKKRALGLETT